MLVRTWSERRLDFVTVALLLLVTIAAWAGVVVHATGMPMHDLAAGGMAAGREPLLTPGGLAASVAAWVVMMAAMMLPSSAPMILLYHATVRDRAGGGGPFLATGTFVVGYLAVWAAFGAVVYVVGRVVGVVLAGDPRRAAWAPYGVALVLATAGLYQFTALKRVCLRACRHPLAFVLRHWKPGISGAFGMGVRHGWYCTGCCWGLMAVLVAAGAMGLAWVLLIALVVAAEKLLPRWKWTARLTGSALIALGALVAAQPQLVQALRSPGM